MSITINLRIFSPRWGHDDTYSVVLDTNFMTITMGPRVARSTWRENQDPEWSGESIQRIMRNDHIYPPAVSQKLFEHVWKEWRSGEITEKEAQEALQEVAAWLNAVTRAKPSSAFWKAYF